MQLEDVLTKDQLIRLRCAEIAGDSANHTHVASAQALYDFITGTHDKTPLEKITAALRDAGVK